MRPTEVADDVEAVKPTSPQIDLSRHGPTEAEWRAVLDDLPVVSFARGEGRRVVVVAPHPDDESLGAGGTVAMLADAGADVRFVCLTDGEAAPCPTPDLAAVRRRELAAAARLLAPRSTVTFCGLPDGRLRECPDEVGALLDELIGTGDLVLATLDGDGHPDHDAAGRLAQTVAAACSAELWWFAVWAPHWHDPLTSPLSARGRRSELTNEAMTRKRAAIECHRSQLSGEAAIVPAAHMPRFERPYEVLVRA